VEEVLSIWRDSVPEELREKWLNINPHISDDDEEASEDDPGREETASGEDE
jgi:hypothetical protein